MKTNREELVSILAAVKPGLANKEIIEQATHFVFGANEVYTYNDKISINHETDFDIGDFAVKADEFYSLLSKFKQETIDIELEKGKLKIEAGKTKGELVIDTEIKLPEVPLPEEWIILPPDFTDRLLFCLFSVGKNMTKLAFTCLNIKEDSIESCDNHRLTVAYFNDGTSVEEPFILPGSAAEQVLVYEPVEYALMDQWIHFQNDSGVIFSCRRLEVEYPDLSSLLKADGEEIQLPEEIKDAVDQVATLATQEFEQDRFITLTLSKNKLACKGEGSLGWVETEMSVKYAGKKTSLRLHPTHFLDILQHLESVVLSDKNLLFEGNNFVHVISLIN